MITILCLLGALVVLVQLDISNLNGTES